MTDGQTTIEEQGVSPSARRSGVLERLQNLPSPVVYGLGLFLSKAFAFITVPLAAHYIIPSDYGQFAVAMSFVEILTIIASFGMGQQLIRFASVEETTLGAERVARELFGSALVCFSVFALITQLGAPLFMDAFGIRVDETAFRFLLLAGSITALVELPLFWFRLRDRAWAYLTVMLARTFVGFLAMWAVLHAGYGVTGLIIANSLVVATSAVAVSLLQYRSTGVSLSRARFVQVARYGAPIVGAGVAMYLLGNGNRLFMSEQIEDDMIGFFDMANRFAIIVFLLYAPFELWWQPKRIKILKEPGGLEKSAEFWSLGVAILLLAGGAVSLTAPIFVELAMPDKYGPASDAVPFLALAQVLLFLAMLTSVGAYARETGFTVLAVDLTGAGVAVIGYFALIPSMGQWGVVLAMYAGNLTRLGLYYILGRKTAPIPYPWARIGLGAAATALVVALAPDQEQWALRLAYSVFAGLALFGFLVALRLLRPLEGPLRKLLERARSIAHVR